MFTVTGGTYAYLAFTAIDSNTIVGTTATVGLDLKVERILPSTAGVLVPQLEQYLGSAISTKYSCIDGNGNTACHVYKATIKNTSNATVEVTGTIKFSGIENMPNLKWKRITSERTIGGYTSNKASTGSVIFENNRSFEKNESDDYYFVIWIDETEEEQIDSGTFKVTIEFNPSNGDGLTSTVIPINAYASSYMIPGFINDASLDFSKTSSESNSNGVYLRSGTENDKYPIYYYRGNVKNNLIFAGFCWKVVRTTETGGLKLIYNGIPTDNNCNNKGISATIGNKVFNTPSNSPAYVGYMYGTPYTVNAKTMTGITDLYKYGNSVTYSNGSYTLTNTKSGVWSSLYSSGLKNNHYTCFTTGTTCESVYYITNTNSSTAYYVTLTNGKKIENALSEMLDNNTTSSTIKGDYQTEGTLDYWYYTNIEQKGYSSYIEDTVWCNDRSISALGGWDPNGGSLNATLNFSAWDRMDKNIAPSLNCSRAIDKFTVSSSKGNGALDYPVGLLTADEIRLAGASSELTANSSYYLYNEDFYWASSPFAFYNVGGIISYIYDDGHIDRNVLQGVVGVRPSISLKSGFTLTGTGDGSVSTPYKVNY